jgi:hypothetical protein
VVWQVITSLSLARICVVLTGRLQILVVAKPFKLEPIPDAVSQPPSSAQLGIITMTQNHHDHHCPDAPGCGQLHHPGENNTEAWTTVQPSESQMVYVLRTMISRPGH